MARGKSKASKPSTATRTRELLTRNWAGLRPIRMQRLGAFLTQIREDAQESGRELAELARADHEKLSQPSIVEAENLRHLAAQGHEPAKGPSILSVMWRVYHAGHTLADLEAFMNTGDAQFFAPADRSRAQAVYAGFLALPESGKQQVERFMQIVSQMETEGGEGSAMDDPDNKATSGAAEVDERLLRETAQAKLESDLDTLIAERETLEEQKRQQEPTRWNQKRTGA